MRAGLFAVCSDLGQFSRREIIISTENEGETIICEMSKNKKTVWNSLRDGFYRFQQQQVLLLFFNKKKSGWNRLKDCPVRVA